MTLPPLPRRQVLSDACRQEAARQGIDPLVVEKDFYLTRLIWALGQERREQLLLKGGTCLSKCDLGYHRMSEDADFVIPWSSSTSYRRTNATQTNQVRNVLRTIARETGVALRTVDGDRYEQASHIIWTVTYPSELSPNGEGSILIEAARPSRRAATPIWPLCAAEATAAPRHSPLLDAGAPLDRSAVRSRPNTPPLRRDLGTRAPRHAMLRYDYNTPFTFFSSNLTLTAPVPLARRGSARAISRRRRPKQRGDRRQRVTDIPRARRLRSVRWRAVPG